MWSTNRMEVKMTECPPYGLQGGLGFRETKMKYDVTQLNIS